MGMAQNVSRFLSRSVLVTGQPPWLAMASKQSSHKCGRPMALQLEAQWAGAMLADHTHSRKGQERRCWSTSARNSARSRRRVRSASCPVATSARARRSSSASYPSASAPPAAPHDTGVGIGGGAPASASAMPLISTACRSTSCSNGDNNGTAHCRHGDGGTVPLPPLLSAAAGPAPPPPGDGAVPERR